MIDRRPMHWRLRRGMRELDVLLSRWYEDAFAAADEALQHDFDALLEEEDPDIWAWLMGRAEPPARYGRLIAALRND